MTESVENTARHNELYYKMLGNSRVDERFHHIVVRQYVSDAERQYMSDARNSSWPHIRPRSVLVASMSFHWKPGAWEKVVDMINHTQAAGYYVGLSEIQDRCFNPYDALGTMRNEAALVAHYEGFEWVLYIDNDVMPEKDYLIKLLERGYPIMVPYVVEPGTGKPLFGPAYSPNQGMQPAKWSVLSMIMFRTNVFSCFPPGGFWGDAIGSDEGFHFQKLWAVGHRPYIDTDLPLEVKGAPHYPLSSNRLTMAERMELWDLVNQRRAEPPDRRPLETGKSIDRFGQYMPWAAPWHDPATASLSGVPSNNGNTQPLVNPVTGSALTPDASLSYYNGGGTINADRGFGIGQLVKMDSKSGWGNVVG